MGYFGKILDSEPRLGQSLLILWDEVKYYPTWLYSGDENHVWPEVYAAIRTILDDRQDIILRNGNTFTFTSNNLKTDINTPKCNLEIYCNKKIIASLYTHNEGDSHALSGVEFINDGIWSRELFDFLEWKKSHDEKTNGRK